VPASLASPTAARDVRAFLTVYERLPRETYLALADHARRRGIAFAGHVPAALYVVEASDAGRRSVEHLSATMLACHPRAVCRAADQCGGRRTAGATATVARASRAYSARIRSASARSSGRGSVRSAR
jgi:hypothetical protein